MAQPPDSRIGQYRIIEPIGAGGFATVYRAEDERLQSEVAIKVLAENHSLDPDIRERFLREGQLLRRLDHPEVVTVHDVGETDDGQPYLVLTYAEHGDLDARVTMLEAERSEPGPADLLAVVEFLGRSVGEIHRSDLVHRDLSPTNVLIRTRHRDGPPLTMLSDSESFLLSDLGYAKDLTDTTPFTRGGGTPGFRSPEQRTPAGIVDQRADVYGATALLAWLADRADLAEPTPARLRAEFARGLANDPEERHATIAEWTESMRTILADATRAGGAAAIPTLASRRRWYNQPAVALAALLLIVLGGAALALSIDRSPTGTEAAPPTSAVGSATSNPSPPSSDPTDPPDTIEADDPSPTVAGVTETATTDGATPTTSTTVPAGSDTGSAAAPAQPVAPQSPAPGAVAQPPAPATTRSPAPAPPAPPNPAPTSPPAPPTPTSAPTTTASAPSPPPPPPPPTPPPTPTAPTPVNPIVLYDDGVASGWSGDGWGGSFDFNVAITGGRAIRANLAGYGAVAISRNDAVDLTGVTGVELFIRTATPGARFGVRLNESATVFSRVCSVGSVTSEWRRVRIPIQAFALQGSVTNRVAVVEQAGVDAEVWVDQVRLVRDGSGAGSC